jgi:hypothetical protein
MRVIVNNQEIPMKPIQLVVVIVLSVIVGIAVASLVETPKVQAQGAGTWEIVHGAYGEGGNAGFYAIKHNRSTGEVWVLSAERGATDDVWLKLPEEVKPAKK